MHKIYYYQKNLWTKKLSKIFWTKKLSKNLFSPRPPRLFSFYHYGTGNKQFLSLGLTTQRSVILWLLFAKLSVHVGHMSRCARLRPALRQQASLDQSPWRQWGHILVAIATPACSFDNFICVLVPRVVIAHYGGPIMTALPFSILLIENCQGLSLLRVGGGGGGGGGSHQVWSGVGSVQDSLSQDLETGAQFH